MSAIECMVVFYKSLYFTGPEHSICSIMFVERIMNGLGCGGLESIKMGNKSLRVVFLGVVSGSVFAILIDKRALESKEILSLMY